MGKMADMAVDRAIQAASRRLGYSSLRREQEEAIKNFAVGKDVFFLSVPTGGGKSLCYAILPWLFDELRQTPCKSIVMVVSPIIALIKDQVRCTFIYC